MATCSGNQLKVTVIDATTGAALQGALVSVAFAVGGCPCQTSALGVCVSYGGCTTGSDYTGTANTDSSGQACITSTYSADTSYVCTCSAVGYQNTSVQGSIPQSAGPGAITVQLSPVAVVPQANQGTGAAAGVTANSIANHGAQLEKWLSSTIEYIIIAGVVVGILLVIVAIYA